MNRCCAHAEEEHHVLPTCQEVIHYPSEDYPCLCTRFAGSGDRCEDCHHPRKAHVITRVCKPDSGEFCDCRREVG